MKLQISYDFTTLLEALEVAKKTAQFADILEIGTQLLYGEGVDSIRTFKKEFPDKIILADAKLVDRVEETIKLFAQAGADYVSVLIGTSNKVIQKAVSIAHENNTKILLDLIDTQTMTQAARDAETLEVDALLFHAAHDARPTVDKLEEWQSVRENTDLPIFISGRIDKENINEILKLKPQGIVIGEAITNAKDPAKEAEYFAQLIKK